MDDDKSKLKRFSTSAQKVKLLILQELVAGNTQ